ncbi:MAG: hypothetical protein HRT72_13070 [Flavobacteriales bacterium]|nr:hypothetical protein [Flavobacteriales bacterium]
MIEEKIYSKDSTYEGKQFLLDKVFELDENVIYLEEPSKISSFQIELMFEKVKKFLSNTKGNYFLINLTNTSPPNAEQRAKLREVMGDFSSQIKHAAVYTGKNILISQMVNFVLLGVGFGSYSIHKSCGDALKAIMDAKNR